MSDIRLRGARENNLKNLDIDIPREQLVVISGLSGSGKSSLLFDTIYAEGQRRYIESLSTYTRQFLERLRRPDIDSLEGIGPAVAIRQRNSVQHSRSTVATYTEIADFLRVLFTRAGTQYCSGCGRTVTPDSASRVAEQLLTELAGEAVMPVFPFRSGNGLSGDQVREILVARGFSRLVTGGALRRLDEATQEELLSADVLVVIDRLKIDPENRDRLAEAVEIAYREGEGHLRILNRAGVELFRFAEGATCAVCETVMPEPQPSLFSFQRSEGACPECRGYGNNLVFDEIKVVPNPGLTLEEGALAPWSSPRFEHFHKRMLGFCRENGIATKEPFSALPETRRQQLIRGGSGFTGVIPWLDNLRSKAYKKYARFFSRRYMSEHVCQTCNGSRLRSEVDNIRLGEWTMASFCRLPLEEAQAALNVLDIGNPVALGVDRVLEELSGRLRFLNHMGLHYLQLDRPTRTLSGGEFQRIHLANSLGSHLTDTLYALDEPTVGLHPRDTDRLLSTLIDLRDQGNSVLVVEHDPEVIRGADRLLDLGPGSGAGGGELVYNGPVRELPAVDHDHPSATIRFLADLEPLTFGEAARRRARGHLSLQGVTKHNIVDLDVEFPLGQLVAVSGVSGSGKSTLVTDVLVSALSRPDGPLPGDAWRHLRGVDRIHSVKVVNQDAVGKSPRSNPATYLGAFHFIRQLYASRLEARKLHLGQEHFSFNSKEGRCPECKGLGSMKMEMVFMADLYIPCEACGGSRFRSESLQVRYKGRTIAEVLNMTVDEAIRFFSGHHALGERLWMLHRVGLGYLKLGQGAITLSGGESQRLKIARELAEAGHERKLYILDEPTTGLHPLDVRQLLAVFQRLLKIGHSIIVVEHNLQVLLAADHIIDMGPEGGGGGGRIIAEGLPEEIAANPVSITGRYLKPLLQRM
ncbi:MAG: excinuclease ABC subunit UvrA [bacterium]|nr:excinuclease ABC subunit UvrA [bacterium]